MIEKILPLPFWIWMLKAFYFWVLKVNENIFVDGGCSRGRGLTWCFLQRFLSLKWSAELGSWEKNFGAKFYSLPDLSDPWKISNMGSKEGELNEARERNKTPNHFMSRVRERASPTSMPSTWQTCSKYLLDNLSNIIWEGTSSQKLQVTSNVQLGYISVVFPSLTETLLSWGDSLVIARTVLLGWLLPCI